MKCNAIACPVQKGYYTEGFKAMTFPRRKFALHRNGIYEIWVIAQGNLGSNDPNSENLK